MQQLHNLKSFLNLKAKQDPNLIPNLAFLFFIITRVIAISLSFPCITDITLYLKFFIKLGIFEFNPYQEFAFEYPPLALIPIYISGLIADKDLSINNYYLSFAALMFAIDCCCLQLCRIYCQKHLKMDKYQIAYMVTLYALFGLMMFRLLYHRLDLLVALFLILSLLLFDAKNKNLKFSFLLNAILGFFYKILPAFNLPISIVAKAFHSSENLSQFTKQILLNSLIFLSIVAAVILSLEIYSNHHFIDNMLYHQKRGIQIESSYSSLLLFANLISEQRNFITYFAFGSWNISSPAFLESLSKYLGILIILSFYSSVFFILAYKKKHKLEFSFCEKQFLESTLIIILLFLAFQRVLSPQFFIWLIPLAAIWIANNRSKIYLIAFCAIYFATFAIFSIQYLALMAGIPALVIALILRNVILLVTTIMISKNFLKTLISND